MRIEDPAISPCTKFFLFSKFLWFKTIRAIRSSRTRAILNVHIFTVLKKCIQDKFCMQKLMVTKGFFKVEVLSDFDFGQFWRNWLQRHLVGKVLQVQNSFGHYQYVSLVCETHLKFQENLFDIFFHFKMNC